MSKFGTLNAEAGVPFDARPGGEAGDSTTFTFTRKVEGDAGYIHTNTITAKGKDAWDQECQASDDAQVTILDVAPQITVTKTADPTHVPETGGDVTFTITVTNTGSESVTLIDAVDTAFGADRRVALRQGPTSIVGEVATATLHQVARVRLAHAARERRHRDREGQRGHARDGQR